MTSTAQLEELSQERCLQLLQQHHVGRLAVVVHEQPLILPVNYGLSGRTIVFRTDPGTKLHAAVGHRVAFEIDSADALFHEGWSVLVTGRAVEEKDPLRIHQFESLGVRPWGPGPKAHWLSIRKVAITGRRIIHEPPSSEGATCPNN